MDLKTADYVDIIDMINQVNVSSLSYFHTILKIEELVAIDLPIWGVRELLPGSTLTKL
jgi:hypothetical protein